MGSPSKALPPGTRLGRYVVVDRIGRGGMAEVHLARARGLHGFEKTVALKVIHGHLVDDPIHVELLLKEARIAATLDHPSIVQVFDVGVDGDQYYLCMEYVHGVDARHILRTLAGESTMPLLLALLIVHEVAAALHYAHTRRDAAGHPLGIVHRDVSPSNVIIAFDGAVKLTDFGIAKVTAHTSHTSTGTLKGKFGYMSPEQSLQQEIDARSDVFALGVLLFELTTGRRAFAGESAFAAMNAVIEGIYTPPETLVPGYPPALAAIVRRALAVEPDDRFPTADALRQDIDALARSLGGPATLPELGRFAGDLFGWPPLPDLSALDPENAGHTEIVIGASPPPTVAQRRGRSLMLVGAAAAIVGAATAGYTGWYAGRLSGRPAQASTGPRGADVARPSLAGPGPDAQEQPSFAAGPPIPSAPSDPPRSTFATASPPPKATTAATDSPPTERSSPTNKRKRRRGQRDRTDKASGIEAILPPSARREP